MLATPVLLPLCTIEVALDPVLELGQTVRGRRRIVPIVGGRFHGERLNGRVLHLGADWQTIFADGSAELDTRYALQTNDGALIDIRNFGFRHGPPDVMAALAQGEAVDPARYYMRTHPRFETADPRYEWLNRTICVGSGARFSTHVEMAVFEVR